MAAWRGYDDGSMRAPLEVTLPRSLANASFGGAYLATAGGDGPGRRVDGTYFARSGSSARYPIEKQKNEREEGARGDRSAHQVRRLE